MQARQGVLRITEGGAAYKPKLLESVAGSSALFSLAGFLDIETGRH